MRKPEMSNYPRIMALIDWTTAAINEASINGLTQAGPFTEQFQRHCAFTFIWFVITEAETYADSNKRVAERIDEAVQDAIDNNNPAFEAIFRDAKTVFNLAVN